MTGWDPEGRVFTKTYGANTAEQFIYAMNKVQPGEAIIVGQGIYDWGTITWPETVNGTRENPIYVIPESICHGVFTGDTSFVVKGSFIQFSGLYFRDLNHSAFELYAGSKVQIKYSYFSSIGKSAYESLAPAQREDPNFIVQTILVHPGSKETELSHNTFIDIYGQSIAFEQAYPDRDKLNDPSYLAQLPTTKGPDIHHNSFQNILLRRSNGGEPIMLGWGLDTGLPGFDNVIGAFISYNLFDNAIGDSEVISVKSSGNYVYHNYVKNCGSAHITIREGDDNVVAYNLIDGVDIGLEISGSRNYFIYNILNDDAGSAAIYIHNGDYSAIDQAIEDLPAQDNYIARNVFLSAVADMLYERPISANTTWVSIPTGNFIFDNMFLSPLPTFSFYDEAPPGELLSSEVFFSYNHLMANYQISPSGGGIYQLNQMASPLMTSATIPTEVQTTLDNWNGQDFSF